MKLQAGTVHRNGRRFGAGFTLMEMMVAVGISGLAIAMLTTFIVMVARSTSGIVKQSVVNGQAGYTSEFIFSRVRFATSVSASGNVLTLGFDDNINVDSNNDKKAYNDQDHYEVFMFNNGDGNDATTSNNKMLYKKNSAVLVTNVLISSGIAKLPGKSVFSVVNGATVLLNYGLTDNYAADGYQQCDVQAIFVARNRPDNAAVITILP